MRMNCTEAQAELPLFVGGDLESSVHERVAVHLESCETCSELMFAATDSREVLVAGLHHTADLHGAFVATSKTPSVWPGLRDQLRAEGLILRSLDGTLTPEVPAALPANSAPRGKLLHWVSSSAAAAALLLFGALAGQLWSGSGTGHVSPVEQGSSGFTGGPVANQQNHLSGAGGAALTPAFDGGNRPLAGLTPVLDQGMSLKRVECAEDSFTRDAIYFTGQEVQPFNAFQGSGLTTPVSYSGGALPALTVHPGGIR